MGPQCLSDRTSSLVAVPLFPTAKVDICGYHAWKMRPCLHDDTTWLRRGGWIVKHHPSTGRPVTSSSFCPWCWKSAYAEENQGVLLDEILDVLYKMSYHRFVGAAILLLAISSTVRTVSTTESSMTSRVSSARSSGMVLVNGFPISIIIWTGSIADGLLVRETFFVSFGVSIYCSTKSIRSRDCWGTAITPF